MTAESASEIVEKCDSSVQVEQHDEAAFSEKGTCTLQNEIFAPQLVTVKESTSKTQETVGLPKKKQNFKSKPAKKTPILWKTRRFGGPDIFHRQFGK